MSERCQHCNTVFSDPDFKFHNCPQKTSTIASPSTKHEAGLESIRIRPEPTEIPIGMGSGPAMKQDGNKTPVELLPFQALFKVSEVLQFGARKYDSHNWRKGMKWSRLLGAALRHVFAWASGEAVDQETGISHLAHAACDLLFLIEYELTKSGTDDRWIQPLPVITMEEFNKRMRE